MQDPMQDKEELRSRYHDERNQVTPHQREVASGALCERLASVDLLEPIKHLGGYISIRNEIDVTASLQTQIARGVHVYLPRVIAQNRLEFVAVESMTGLVRGPFGIPEPTGPAVDLQVIEAFLVPGLAFDRQGGRLGFGKGYYDRVLASAPQEQRSIALTIGICYHWQLSEASLPSEAHDVPMDLIVTDQELLVCSHSVTSK